MKIKTLSLILVSCLVLNTACSQNDNIKPNNGVEKSNKELSQKEETKKQPSHRYGGWYCPDNLNGFPAVDIANWSKVPVVNGRLATKEETQTEASLIFVDIEKYPNAMPLDITMPKLANFYNHSTKRDELIIVIQALNIDNDSIVGFRYINGGNGSARLKEVQFLSFNEMEMIPKSRFVSHSIQINATQEEIWQIMSKPENAKAIQPAFDKDYKLKTDWREKHNVNYSYEHSGKPTAKYANKLFGCYYVQNDYDKSLFTEKFLLLEDEKTKITELKIVCGPYAEDFEDQKVILNNWAQKVKELSEQ